MCAVCWAQAAKLRSPWRKVALQALTRALRWHVMLPCVPLHHPAQPPPAPPTPPSPASHAAGPLTAAHHQAAVSDMPPLTLTPTLATVRPASRGAACAAPPTPPPRASMSPLLPPRVLRALFAWVAEAVAAATSLPAPGSGSGSGSGSAFGFGSGTDGGSVRGSGFMARARRVRAATKPVQLPVVLPELAQALFNLSVALHANATAGVPSDTQGVAGSTGTGTGTSRRLSPTHSRRHSGGSIIRHAEPTASLLSVLATCQRHSPFGALAARVDVRDLSVLYSASTSVSWDTRFQVCCWLWFCVLCALCCFLAFPSM